MKFRNINIPLTVYQVLRANYSIRRDVVDDVQVLSLSNLYKFIVCCLFALVKSFADYDSRRRRDYMIASCMPIQGQMQLVLNKIYGTYGFISVIPGGFQSVYFYDKASSTSENQVYLYTGDSNEPLYLGYQGASSNTAIITIPAALFNDPDAYSSFIATVNSIVMYGIAYEIQIQG